MSESGTETRWPLDLAACHGRMDALRAALQVADDALISCTPYVNNVRTDPQNAPWRRETAEQTFDKLRGTRDLIAAELMCDE